MSVRQDFKIISLTVFSYEREEMAATYPPTKRGEKRAHLFGSYQYRRRTEFSGQFGS